MMAKYKYSAKTNEFFPYALQATYQAAEMWPEDGVDFEEEVFITWKSENAPAGKVRVAGQNGLPAWEDTPPLSQEERVTQADLQKQKLRLATDAEIAWRQDAVDAELATEEETAALAAWKKYRVLLMRVDTATAPGISWPAQPE